MKKTTGLATAVIGYGGFSGPAPALGLAWLILNAVLTTTEGADTFTNTGTLNIARSGHTSTRLLNGKVLAVGGFFNGSSLVSAELYDPATGVWTATGNLPNARSSHTATLLPDGRVLVAGGSSSGAITNAALYDPATGFWTNTGPLATGRYSHTATLLPNGKVLVAGGTVGPLASAELYDPVTGLWTNTGNLATAREAHTATLLPNGQLLVAGGSSGSTRFASAELYVPATGLWTNTTGPLATARTTHAAALLPNGKVLVTGGTTTGGVHLNSAEIYDPSTGLWSATGSFTAARRFHTATMLPGGLLLIAGGLTTGGDYVAGAELYNFVFGTWSTTGPLAAARYNHTGTLLSSGRLLVAGGVTTGGAYLASAELYNPVSVVDTLPATGGTTLNGRANLRSLPTSAWFEWGPTTNYGNVTMAQNVGSGTGSTNFSQAIIGLTAGVTYHFRAVASNSVGTAFGEDQAFFIPTFQSIQRLANGEIQTHVIGPANAAYLMEASTNLSHWKLIAALHASNSPALFQDLETGRFAQRFYRYSTFPAFQASLFYFLDSEIGVDGYLFKPPNHSSTTAAFIYTTMPNTIPNFVRVANVSFSGGPPTNGLHVSWVFADGPVSPWVRLDTFNTDVYPNPIIEFSKGLCFDIYTDRDFYVALGLREANANISADVGSDGGTTGPIEWVGVTVNNSVSPPLGRLVTAGKWQRLCFHIPAEPVRAFTGNGVLESTTGKGVFEHLALVPVNHVPMVTNNIYLANFQTLEPIP